MTTLASQAPYENLYQLKYSGEEVDDILSSADTGFKQHDSRLSQIESSMAYKVDRRVERVELPSGQSWNTENGVYVHEVKLPDITKDTTPHIVPLNIDPANYNATISAWNCITKAESATGCIIFYCYDNAPTAALTLQIEYFV